MERDQVQLRHKTLNILVFALVWGGVVSVLYSYWSWGGIEAGYIILVTIALVVVAFPAAFLTDRLLPIMPTEKGIKTYNLLSMPRTVRWDRIRGVKRINFWPMVPYLQIIDDKGYFSRGLLPLFSDDRKAFYEKVVEIKGEDHPLAVALRQHSF